MRKHAFPILIALASLGAVIWMSRLEPPAEAPPADRSQSPLQREAASEPGAVPADNAEETEPQPVQKNEPVVAPVSGLPAADYKALAESADIMERGLVRLATCPDYTARFFKQERIDGRLREPKFIDLRVRHEPFSVFMRWPEQDQVACYIDGENDNRLLVKAGGWKRALGTLRLRTDSALALRESRHPVTEAGLQKLLEELLSYRRRDLELDAGVHCRGSEDHFQGRDCVRYQVWYDGPEIEPLYRKAVVYLDCEWNLPLCVQNFTWRDVNGEPSDEDPETLIEHYAYHDLRLDVGLASAAFDVNGNHDAVALGE